MTAINDAMRMLAAQPNAIFIGQGVGDGGDGVATYNDLEGVPMEQRIEFPVAEELQMGVGIGLALQGFLPILIYPRCDFLLRAADQLVNHLDKLAKMSDGEFQPKVIIRTRVGKHTPLDAGPQHTQNHVAAFRAMLQNVVVCEIKAAEHVGMFYQDAVASPRSWLIVESY